MRRIRSTLLGLLWPLLACGQTTEDRATPSATPSADASAVCEHGVQRELCPKCDPRLAAVYQSANDWCDEHGMPESFCPVCHPEAKGAPVEGVAATKPEVPSKAPRDGLVVRLQSLAVLAGAGLETSTVTKSASRTSARFPARIVYDATRTAEVTASGGGVIRSVAVDLGARVEVGQALAVLDSADVGGDRSRLSAAYQRVKAAEDRVKRATALEREGVVAKRDRLEAELVLDEAKAEASALSLELGINGASVGKGGSYTLVAPIAGVVTRQTATIGTLVEERTPLFQVVDPRVVWAELDIPEASALSVRVKSEVIVKFPSIPSESFAGTVDVLLPEVDRHTRTVVARVSLDNAKERLRANMFGEAAILGTAEPGTVAIPRAAVQTVDRQRLVFVQTDPLTFQVRHVVLAGRDGEVTLISEGLRAGEEVVTTGSFLLKTETLKDSIGAGCCAGD